MVEIVDPARLMVEATTPDVTLGARLAGASLLGVEGVKLQLVGAARAFRDGVLPLSFRIQASPTATPLALGQPLTLVAALNELRKGIVLPASAIVRSPANEPVGLWPLKALDGPAQSLGERCLLLAIEPPGRQLLAQGEIRGVRFVSPGEFLASLR